MSTKLSPQDVNKLGFRFRPLSDGVVHGHDAEVLDPKPLTVPMRLPTIEQRLRMFEMAGAARQAFFDEIAEADFLDDYDDIPEEGLTPHESHPIRDGAAQARADRLAAARKASEKPKDASVVTEGVSPSGEDITAPEAQ